MNKNLAPIGVFDSGYGGLTILKEIIKTLPQYDYLYLGDNARNPYGSRSFDVVYAYTLQAVRKLFELGCPLVILACNTASAKALRSIQQNDLPRIAPSRRVLGVIRPSVEEIPNLSKNGHIGVLATSGTVASNSYPLEIEKINESSSFQVSQVACPMWVPIVENQEIETPGADYFIQKYVHELLEKDPLIDTIILGCTHYPLLAHKIRKYIPESVRLIEQGPIVAEKLKDYLFRHPEIETMCSKNGNIDFLTTESIDSFENNAGIFLEQQIKASKIILL
ncbi:MAG: glutamate racemase [Bacteroidota bacterium]|nr:glutamate racemase [Bacteroidota bacterium]